MILRLFIGFYIIAVIICWANPLFAFYYGAKAGMLGKQISAGLEAGYDINDQISIRLSALYSMPSSELNGALYPICLDGLIKAWGPAYLGGGVHYLAGETKSGTTTYQGGLGGQAFMGFQMAIWTGIGFIEGGGIFSQSKPLSGSNYANMANGYALFGMRFGMDIPGEKKFEFKFTIPVMGSSESFTLQAKPLALYAGDKISVSIKSAFNSKKIMRIVVMFGENYRDRIKLKQQKDGTWAGKYKLKNVIYDFGLQKAKVYVEYIDKKIVVREFSYSIIQR
ncbi:MAG: hypothetical protein V1843_01820 [bacterium]